MTNDTEVRSTADDRTITIRRVIPAPRALVFRVWNDPVHITRWWGPHGFTTTTYSHDFRVGGRWHFTMHGPDGTDFPNLVTYTAIEPDRRLAYDHGESAENPLMFQAEILFDDKDGGTEVTLRMTSPTAAFAKYMREFGAIEGGENTLERLETVVASFGAA